MAKGERNVNVKTVVERISQCLEQEDYYTALQLYKMLSNRYEIASHLQAGRESEARDVLRDGAIIMFNANHLNSAYELAMSFVNFLKANTVPVSPNVVMDVLKVFSHYPQDGADFMVKSFINKSISWSANAQNNFLGAAELHLQYAKFYQNNKNYQDSENHYLRARDMSQYTAVAKKHITECDVNERDLNVVKIILQCFTQASLKESFVLADTLMSMLSDEEKNLQMYQFLRSLILALKSHSYTQFKAAKDKHAVSIARDSSIESCLQKISVTHFNVESHRRLDGFAEVFNSLMGGANTESVTPIQNFDID